MNKPKIILFDIETIPDMKSALKVWPQLSNYPALTMKATITSIICVGYKELYEKRTHCINAWDFPNWEKDINDDREVLKAICKILEKADAVVTHNGKRFDWKHIQTRLMLHKLPPLPPIIHIDTCVLSRSNLLSFNNRLGYLGKWLVGDTKLENGGWDLWEKVANRVKKSQKLMTKYCKQDVDLLEKVFIELRPFVKNLPNQNLYRSVEQIVESTYLCPTCGSTDIKKWGYYHTKTISYQRIRCKNCGSTGRLDAKGGKPRAI